MNIPIYHYPVTPDVIHGTPKALGKVADKFPALMGGRNSRESIDYLSGRKNVWHCTA